MLGWLLRVFAEAGLVVSINHWSTHCCIHHGSVLVTPFPPPLSLSSCFRDIQLSAALGRMLAVCVPLIMSFLYDSKWLLGSFFLCLSKLNSKPAGKAPSERLRSTDSFTQSTWTTSCSELVRLLSGSQASCWNRLQVCVRQRGVARNSATLVYDNVT